MVSSLRSYWRDIINNNWSLGSWPHVSERHISWRQTDCDLVEGWWVLCSFGWGIPCHFVSYHRLFFFFFSLHVTFHLNMYICAFFFVWFFLSVDWAPPLNPSQPFFDITAEDPAPFHGWHVESMLSAYQFSVLLVRWSVLGCCLVDAACCLTIAYLACLLWFPGGHTWRCLKKISSSSPDMIIWVVFFFACFYVYMAERKLTSSSIKWMRKSSITNSKQVSEIPIRTAKKV